MNLLQEKNTIIENDGIYYERYHNMSPVLARVFAYLMLNGENGLCFDDLKETIGASKSSISTCLSTLLDRKLIDYFTKPGDRKRYFISSPRHFLTNLENELEKYEMALKNQKARLLFKIKSNTQIDESFDQYLIPKEPNLYTHYLEEQIDSTKRLIEYIQNFQEIQLR